MRVECFSVIRTFVPSSSFTPGTIEPTHYYRSSGGSRNINARRPLRLLQDEGEDTAQQGSFEPFDLLSSSSSSTDTASMVLVWSSTMTMMFSDPVVAEELSKKAAIFSRGNFNPDNFKPVCATSDGFYRLLQTTTEAIVGEEQFVEFGPLIAGGLLRIRLELCVVESFFNEAVGPFIQKNGLTWILPLHETVETFLAGTIFALASTFILVGSTKIVSVVAVYGDFFFGVPCRLFGGFFFDRARGKPVTFDIGIGPWKKRLVGPPITKEERKLEDSKKRMNDNYDLTEIVESFGNLDATAIPLVFASGSVKALGEISKILKDISEGIDVFVGRYLVIFATGYIGIKFIHFKIFPDFPPFS